VVEGLFLAAVVQNILPQRHDPAYIVGLKIKHRAEDDIPAAL
jgi:hypothetical protein